MVSAPILVATGTRREAATLTQPGFLIIPGGGDSIGLRAKLTEAAEDARGIMSFGFAGALDDTLCLGDWVIGNRLAGSIKTTCDPAWAAALAVQLPGARIGTIYADGRLISSVPEKLALGEQHSAVAVDMESHIAAEVSAERGLPFAIVRCISDEARHVLPPAITVAMLPDGSVNGGAMLASILTQPGQLPALVTTIRGFLRAMAALKRGSARLLPPPPEEDSFKPPAAPFYPRSGSRP